MMTGYQWKYVQIRPTFQRSKLPQFPRLIPSYNISVAGQAKRFFANTRQFPGRRAPWATIIRLRLGKRWIQRHGPKMIRTHTSDWLIATSYLQPVVELRWFWIPQIPPFVLNLPITRPSYCHHLLYPLLIADLWVNAAETCKFPVAGYFFPLLC